MQRLEIPCREDRLDILIEDDDVEAEDFATFGRLLAAAERLSLT